MTVRQLFWILLAYTVIACVIILAAGSAKADEPDFVNHVAAQGVTVDSTTLAVGHGICMDILTNGVDGVQNEVESGYYANVSSHTVAVMIVYAVQDLCPMGTPAVKSWMAQHKSGQLS